MASPQEEALVHVLTGDEEEARRIVALLGRSSRSALRVGLLRLLALLNETDTEEAGQMGKEQPSWRTRQCSVTGCTRRAMHQMASGRAPHRSLFYLCAEHYAAGTVTVIRGTEGPDDG